ncbi:hypothetical protein N1027_04095 [Herbiconiux sp. CPCC 205763]|uniref:Uncharacterized protein n=1 Tax=Herbiconiux aconitum TaxID=2970913 RepID=A0ABT2GM63_9MICO|nr:hypothetical protein [Herbiconiux aconitum]MCS5717314.1 hypothetical protein [Herbiconiux aconitum]
MSKQLNPEDVAAHARELVGESTIPDLELLCSLTVTGNNEAIAEEDFTDAQRLHREAYGSAIEGGWSKSQLRALGIRTPSRPVRFTIVEPGASGSSAIHAVG